MRLSLSHKLTLVFSGFGAVISIYFLVQHVRVARREMYERQRAMAESTVGAMRALVSSQARAGNYGELGRHLAEMIKNVGVAGVVVKDERGRRIVGRSSLSYSSRQPHPGLPIEQAADGFYDVEARVSLGAKGPGTVLVGFELLQLESRLRGITARSLAMGAMAVLAIALAAWVIGTLLGLRLERLVPLIEALPREPETFRPLALAGSGDEVGRLVAAFNRLGQSLKEETVRRRELEREKAELSSMLVHDLKTPLTVIHSGISLLQEQLSEDETRMGKRRGRELAPAQRRRSDQSNRRTFDLLKMSSERLQRMIEDVLQISRMEEVSGLRERAPVDMAAMAKACAKDLAWVAADRDQKIKVKIVDGAEAVVLGDASLLRRVLDNMAHNAVEHTPAGGEIRLAVAPDGPGWLRVSVSDTGPGIPPEAREDIFRKFFQREYKRHVGNVGLGLAFCEKAVLRHGGRIGVSDAKPHGACFYFILPAAPAEAAASPELGVLLERSSPEAPASSAAPEADVAALS